MSALSAVFPALKDGLSRVSPAKMPQRQAPRPLPRLSPPRHIPPGVRRLPIRNIPRPCRAHRRAACAPKMRKTPPCTPRRISLSQSGGGSPPPRTALPRAAPRTLPLCRRRYPPIPRDGDGGKSPFPSPRLCPRRAVRRAPPHPPAPPQRTRAPGPRASTDRACATRLRSLRERAPRRTGLRSPVLRERAWSKRRRQVRVRRRPPPRRPRAKRSRALRRRLRERVRRQVREATKTGSRQLPRARR